MDPVGTLIAGLAVYGIAGLVVIGFADRFIPVIPSYALLAAIGAAVAGDTWPLWAAIGATSLGGVLGCCACFYAIGALGQARAERLVLTIARLCFLPVDRVEGWIRAVRQDRTALAFSLQLVPTARFLSPAIAVLLGTKQRGFLVASSLGIVIWNSTFIGIGYGATRLTEATNMTSLALGMLACLLLAQLGLFWSMRWIRVRRRIPHIAES
ncbi:MAG: VTT domain-containing protein [Mesorhizobium sp.]|nr:VTT domain-containing protein [Mesorhizobium sp.]